MYLSFLTLSQINTYLLGKGKKFKDTLEFKLKKYIKDIYMNAAWRVLVKILDWKSEFKVLYKTVSPACLVLFI